jgi:undecaprenyl pyrophosphate synthase
MGLNNANVDVLLSAYRQKLGITEEEEQQMIAEIQEGSAPTQDMTNIGEMVAVNMEDSQAMAEMVSSFMMEVQQLKEEVEALKQ